MQARRSALHSAAVQITFVSQMLIAVIRRILLLHGPVTQARRGEAEKKGIVSECSVQIKVRRGLDKLGSFAPSTTDRPA